MEAIELMKSLIAALGINWIVVLLYICSGLLVKAYLPGPLHIPFTKLNITDAWRVLIVGTVIVGIYIFIEYRWPAGFTRETLKGLFVSYIFTTSFYEIVLKDTIAGRIINILQKLKPAKEDNV